MRPVPRDVFGRPPPRPSNNKNKKNSNSSSNTNTITITTITATTITVTITITITIAITITLDPFNSLSGFVLLHSRRIRVISVRCVTLSTEMGALRHGPCVARI